MTVKREVSTRTWNEMDHLVAEIRQRAATTGDQQTYADADRISLLLRNQANEISTEDDRENHN